jgi:hypothetical protein
MSVIRRTQTFYLNGLGQRTLAFLAIAFLSSVCSIGCDPLFEIVQDRDSVAKHVIERYLDAEIHNEPIQGFWCRPDAIPRRFDRLKNFEIVKSHQENTDGESDRAGWFAFKVVTRSRTIKAYAGEVTERHIVYVRKVPDGSYKIFGLVPEKEAAYWESIKLRIKDQTDACAFPQ